VRKASTASGTRLAQVTRQRWKEDVQRLQTKEEVQTGPRVARAQEAEDLLEDAGGGASCQPPLVADESVPGLLFDLEAELGGEADRPEQPDRILLDADVRIPDRPQDAALEVGLAAHVIENLAQHHVVEEPVDGEVPALGVLLRGAEGVVAGDEEVLRLALDAGIGAEGGGLDDLAVAEVDVRQPKAPPDEPAVAEDRADLSGVGAGGHVEILRLPAEEKVADAAADQVGLVPEAAQAVDHAQRVGIEPVLRDLGKGPAGRARIGERSRAGGNHRFLVRVVAHGSPRSLEKATCRVNGLRARTTRRRRGSSPPGAPLLAGSGG